MSNKKIQSLLQEALEEEIPSAEINLWPAVQADLAAGTHPQGNQKMNTLEQRRLPRYALALSIFAAMLLVLFATPQGRSFAQSILEFFTRTDAEAFPLEDSQIAPLESQESLPTAAPPSPLLTVAEAESQLGFALAELPAAPAGLEYLGARLYGKSVNIEYQARGGGGQLIIMQSREGYHQSEWDQVPADAIVPVLVGNLEAEFVQGTFVVYPGDTSATWNSDAPILRLRWVDDGVWFEMARYGSVESIEYLDQVELIRLAASLAVQD
jgi:hypothetical protein